VPETYDLETREGVRRVEFDPDIFRSRDVRILVDGQRAAEMAYRHPPRRTKRPPSSSAITPSLLLRNSPPNPTKQGAWVSVTTSLSTVGHLVVAPRWSSPAPKRRRLEPPIQRRSE
jgi:hypothetical protein